MDTKGRLSNEAPDDDLEKPQNPQKPQKLEHDPEDGHDEQYQYPPTSVALLIVLSLALAFFIISLDRTIIGVAVPAITNEFGSFDDVSWYESAYLLTFAALQLPMGKLYTYYRAKWVFFANVVIFEIGSIVSAAAPTSVAVIVGRAISGIGGAGVSTGGQVIICDLFPVETRPKYQGALGAVFGLASIAGPLLGGVFSSKVTWRWCFWINLPIGGVALAMLVLLMPSKKAPKEQSDESLLRRIKEFDPIGTALIIPGMILLLLALQWGGNEDSWSSAKVLSTLIVGIVLIIVFAISQYFSGDNGVVPPRIFRQRTVAAASAVSSGFGAALVIITFYVPIWYQAVKGLTAVDAGIRMLGYFLTAGVFVITSGAAVSKLGYYTPFAIIGTAITIVACGLLSTFSPGTSDVDSIGFQVLAGVGIGLTLAQPINAVQTVLPREDTPIGLTINNFANFAGGTIFVTVCQAVLASTLRSELSSIPGIDVSSVLNSGATDFTSSIPQDQIPAFLQAYSDGFDNIMYTALGVSCFAFVASFFLEWKSVKAKKDEENTESA